MIRVKTKIGDIFSVKINDCSLKYFQLIAFDVTQLNSDVIRAFKREYPINTKPELSHILEDEVDFYAHCVTKLGVKMGYWDKIGTVPDVGGLNHILFRDSSDYGNPQIKISHDWWIWKINEKQRRVGTLVGEYEKAEIGLVINPESIVYRMKNGNYDFVTYPSY